MQDYLDHIFDHVDVNIKLDEEQKRVVLAEGDLEVIAGAGSGKATTMVAKVKYLVDIKKVDPSNILLISYTNKATEELKTRIQKDFGLPIDILTFHKLGLELIRQTKSVDIKTDFLDTIEKIIKEFQKKRKISFFIYTRKYRKKKDLSPLILLSTTFIKNYKQKGKPSISKMKLSKFWKYFFKYLISQYDCYKKENDWIDFEDMILEATNLVQKKKVQVPYRYVIVDEYQDISRDRFFLLYAIKKEYHPNIIVVGDDWQSIFGFSGSELILFTNFKTFFPQSQILKLTNTYRNSQELINIAGNFVMKNKFQIIKQLQSNKNIDNPIQLFSYTQNRSKLLKKILSSISRSRDFSKVFLLGRYHHDFRIEEYPFLSFKNNKIISPYPNLDIEFLTVHSAKGLGADEVILLNCNDEIYGFPTKKKVNQILKNVESIDTSYPYAEERRLFYVALTRTKNHVFVLYQKEKPSIFLTEIKKSLLARNTHFEHKKTGSNKWN